MRAKLTKITMAATLGLALAFTFSCSSDNDDDDKGKPSPSAGTSSSSGGNAATTSSSSGNGGGGNSSSSSQQQGNGGDADCVVKTPFHKGICPAGSHIPTKEEWDALITAAGGGSVATKKLKTNTGWNTYNGTNDFGFAAMPSGYCLSNGTCQGEGFGNNARWWSASEDNATYAYGRSITDNNTALADDNKSDFSSVRCLQDASGNGGGNIDAWGTINLNYDVEGSKCYSNNAANCAKYGRLYNWAAAMALPQKCNSTVSATPSSSSSSGVQGGNSSSGSGDDIGSCDQLMKSESGFGFCMEEIDRSACEQSANEYFSTTFKTGGICSTTEYPCCILEEAGTAEDFGPGFSKERCELLGGIIANPAWCAYSPRG